MAKSKKEQGWTGAWVNWTALCQKQVEVVGTYIEGLNLDEMIPALEVRRDGEWNVSTILETVLIRAARDVQRIAPEQWTRYSEEYFQTRDEGTDKYWHASEVANTALDKIIQRLDSIGFEKLHHAGKINKKLVISMALSYAIDWLTARGH